MLATPQALLVDLLLSQIPEFKQAKQGSRMLAVTTLMQIAWTDAEMNQTIDLHLAHRSDRSGRAQAIEELARNLKLSVGQVSMAVHAVGALDPEDPRRYPRPSKRLARLWMQRGFENKL